MGVKDRNGRQGCACLAGWIPFPSLWHAFISLFANILGLSHLANFFIIFFFQQEKKKETSPQTLFSI